MLVREAVKSTGRADFYAERLGDPRELRNHTHCLAPQDEAAFLPSLAVKPQLVRPARYAIEEVVDTLKEGG
jgi:hypothetical protein